MNFELHTHFVIDAKRFTTAEFLSEYFLESSFEFQIQQFVQEWLCDDFQIEAQTSGTTGAPKRVLLSKAAMKASAKKTASIFQLHAGSTALLAMPIHYIAGKMQIVRALVNQWDLIIQTPSSKPLENVTHPVDFVPLVPNQVVDQISFLKNVKILLIGGAPISKLLWEQLVALRNQLEISIFQSFGATETVSHIAIREVAGDFDSTFYRCLPGVTVETSTSGTLTILAPQLTGVPVLFTNDYVTIQSSTSFKWLGRKDFAINSAGIKIHPEIEELKLIDQIPLPFVIIGIPDAVLFEKVVLVLEGATEIPRNIYSHFEKLERHKRPKAVYVLETFPRTETGKIKRLEVRRLVENLKS
ncbi:MAG: AMP-binding protein [Schleiferiaceae bacterium]|nr:AMP-binding protein [Schleiferiaceae bacterium]